MMQQAGSSSWVGCVCVCASLGGMHVWWGWWCCSWAQSGDTTRHTQHPCNINRVRTLGHTHISRIPDPTPPHTHPPGPPPPTRAHTHRLSMSTSQRRTLQNVVTEGPHHLSFTLERQYKSMKIGETSFKRRRLHTQITHAHVRTRAPSVIQT